MELFHSFLLFKHCIKRWKTAPPVAFLHGPANLEITGRHGGESAEPKRTAANQKCQTTLQMYRKTGALKLYVYFRN